MEINSNHSNTALVDGADVAMGRGNRNFKTKFSPETIAKERKWRDRRR